MPIWIWLSFLVFIIFMLAIDLGLFHKKAHVVSTKEALTWTSVWVTLSLSFNVLVFFMYEYHWFGIGTQPGFESSGQEAALKYITGYLVEYSLSMDNIFVMVMISSYFLIPAVNQHTLLFWGVLGAVVLRGIMIVLGTALIAKFNWIFYVFGIILIISALKMLFMDEKELDPGKNPLINLAKKFFPITVKLDGSKFFIKKKGKWHMTPMFLALIVVETTDLIFAVDSIPAIFAITTDPFIVFTSNIFAILGLRSLYFALANMLNRFQYLKYSLVALLAFIGMKMLVVQFIHIPILLSLGIIVAILALGIVVSLIKSMPQDSDSTTE